VTLKNEPIALSKDFDDCILNEYSFVVAKNDSLGTE
jgi:hypothetical protein